MNAAFTTVETSDKYLPGLESFQIVRTKQEIIMNRLKVEMIAKGGKFKSFLRKPFLSSNINSYLQ